MLRYLTAASLLTLTLADPSLHVVDCVSQQSLNTLLTYHTDAGSQRQPDDHTGLDSSFGDQFSKPQYSGYLTSLGQISLKINNPSASPSSSSGVAVVDGLNWFCNRDDSTRLYANYTTQSGGAPFAQCLSRHVCKQAPAGGRVKVQLQMANECSLSKRDITERQLGPCNNVSPSNELFITTLAPDGSQVCHDVVDLSANTQDFRYKVTSSDTCGVDVYIGDIGASSTDMKVQKVHASNGADYTGCQQSNVGVDVGELAKSLITGAGTYEYNYECDW